MNAARYLWGSLVVFVYILIIEWVFHGLILSGWYNEAMHLLRPESEASAYIIWMILGFLLLAFGFSFIFIKGYEGKGITEGVRYGLYIGLAFAVSNSLIEYAVFPFPGKWIIAWIIGYPIIMMIAGILIAVVYRPKTS